MNFDDFIKEPTKCTANALSATKFWCSKRNTCFNFLNPFAKTASYGMKPADDFDHESGCRNYRPHGIKSYKEERTRIEGSK